MKDHLRELLRAALATLAAEGRLDPGLLRDPPIERTRSRDHGDFASSIALQLARPLHLSPREVAGRILDALPPSPRLAGAEVAGPGFINFTISTAWLATALEAMGGDARLGVAQVQPPQIIVVDYSSPNVAKEMAVHHLRSTVIGDSVVRVLEFLGHRVIRANHIGDWGTQFGMLIAYLERCQQDGGTLELNDCEAFYRAAKELYDRDGEFAALARAYVVRLQSHDEHCLELWRRLVTLTMERNQELYTALGITLTDRDIMGESMYSDMLPGIAADLQHKGLAVEDQGALVVHLDEFRGKDGQPLGVIIRKQDGGYLYATTDLACLRYRVETLHAGRIVYFTDSRQQQHLQSVWAIARRAGYLPEGVSVEHAAFGMMLGRDGRPFRTRTGGTVRLRELLDEACARVGELLTQLGTQLPSDERGEVVRRVAVGAIKYADLSKNRLTDYIFDWDQMLALDGNTAPYLQYAYSRIAALFRRAAIQPGSIIIEHECEIELAGRLLAFGETAGEVGRRAMPHLLCTYLYELAGEFMRFYEACPVLREGTDETTMRSRLALCGLTARVLRQGLDLLGIEVMEHM